MTLLFHIDGQYEIQYHDNDNLIRIIDNINSTHITIDLPTLKRLISVVKHDKELDI